MDLDKYIATLSSTPNHRPTTRGGERGIIYSCHSRSLKWTLISLTFLRKTGCKLPVEIYHMDELSAPQALQLEKFDDVKVVNAKDVIDKNQWDFKRTPDGKLVSLFN